jgi:triacylglycerol lipase
MYIPHPRLEIDALGIHTTYYEAGDESRPQLILLHGMSSSGDSFRELMHELAPHYHLIAPDIPGFGNSDTTEPYTIPHLVEWLASLLDSLRIPEVHLLGHSFGGLVATAFALAYPHHVNRLVLIAPAILVLGKYPEWVRRWSQYKTALSAVKLGNRMVTSKMWLDRQMRIQFYDAARHPETVWERRKQDYQNARSTPDVLLAAASQHLVHRLQDIQPQTCIIWGRQDPILRASAATRLLNAIPHAEAHLLDECGHVPQVEQLTQVTNIVREFLEREVG